MQIKRFIFNPIQVNTFVVSDSTKECIIIDPACYTKEEEIELSNFIEQEKLIPTQILVTHGHFDHVLGLNYVVEKYNIPFKIHEKAAMWLNNIVDYSLMFGITTRPIVHKPEYIDENDKIVFGDNVLKISYIPGHSLCSLAFISFEKSVAFVGDVLFKGSIGRTDLPGGDYNTLLQSITEKLISIGEHLKIYPGHGGESSIGYELQTNPFLSD